MENSPVEIRLVKKEAILDNTTIDLVRNEETKHRTTIAQLKEKKSYLEQNIAKWQADLVETDALIAQVYDEIK